MKTEKRYFSKDYKLKAVALCDESRGSIQSIALKLGIRPDMLGRWKKEHNQEQLKGFIREGTSKSKTEAIELFQLKKQLREVQLERDILKKAVGIFSKSDRLDINLS